MSLVFRHFNGMIKSFAIVNGVLVLPIYGLFGPSLLTAFVALYAGAGLLRVGMRHFHRTVLPVVQVNPSYLSNLA